MSLDAGSVFATLGGRFSNTGFQAFGSAMYRARSDMEATEKRAKTMSQRSQASLAAMGHAAKVGAAGGILAVGAALGYSVKKAADFEQQLSSLQSVSSANARQMQALKKSAMDAGAATKFSALDAAKAQTELAKGGLSVTKILGGGLKGALALAAAGEMDLTDAAATTVLALKQFRLGGGEAMHVADALATAANSTSFDVSDLALALQQGGGAAKAAGLSFDETVTALAALSSQTQSGSDAGTSLKTALVQIAKPTKQSAELMKKLGLDFFDAHGKIEGVADIAGMLRQKLGGLTQEQRVNALTTIAGQDGFRALLALYDAGPAALSKLEQGLQKQGTAAAVAAEKQDNLKGKIENLKGSLETAAITIGEHFLPPLERAAVKATAFINRLAADGTLDRWAAGLVSGGGTAIKVLGDIAHVAGDVAGVGADVAGVLIDIGSALDLGDTTKLEALLAGVVGFKAASTVIPIVASLGSALGNLALNARTAPSLAAFAAELPLLANPVGAAALGVGALAAAFVLLSSRESEESRLARENAAAKKEQAEAIKAVMDAEHAAADKGLAAKQSTLDVRDAEQRLHDARKQHGKDSDEVKRAEIDLDRAMLRSSATHAEYNKAIDQQHAKAQRAIDASKKRRQSAIDEAAALEKQVRLEERGSRTVGGKIVPTSASPQTLASLAAAQAKVSAENQRYIASVARAAVTDASRNRLMQASTQITERNQMGIARLIQALDGIPKEKQTRLLLQDQGSLSKLGTYIASLRGVVSAKTTSLILRGADSAKSALLAFEAVANGVPASKVTKILAQTGSARAEVAALRALIASLTDKTVRVNTVYSVSGTRPGTQLGVGTGGGRRASGRGPVGAEDALVGEAPGGAEIVANPRTGKAFMVAEPTFMRLAPEDYVIPTTGPYAGRGAGLLMDLLQHWGMGAYAKGRPPKKKHQQKKHRPVPHHVDHLAFDPSDLDNRAGKAETHYNTLKQQADDKDKRGHLTAKARRARGKLAQARADLRAARQDAARAKDYAGRIKAQEDYADLAADQMGLADKRDDQAGYDRAKGNRGKALREDRRLLNIAFRHAPKGSAWWRELAKRLGQADIDLQDLSTAQQDAGETEADRIADSGMSDAERGRLADIEAQIALASLTTGLGDDTAAAQQKVGLLEQVLGEIQAAPGQRGGSQAIADIAGQLKSARDNLASLTGGTSQNENADVQAQINQANERTRVANENTRLASAALAAFTGSGDIGEGGRSAYDAARGGNTVVFQSYVPPSPAEARRLADYTVGGMSMQPSRSPSVEVLGV